MEISVKPTSMGFTFSERLRGDVVIGATNGL